MIEYIKGTLEELTPAVAVVEAHGVGYALNISLVTFSAIQDHKEVKLYVDENIVTGGRDDSYTLYGFATKQEREFYRLLVQVNGVGANTARMILSALSPAELANAIANGDERLLKSIKGIGPKAAQRIILELRDKVATMDTGGVTASNKGGSTAVSSPTSAEAIAALTMLGFSPAPTAKVVNKLLADDPTLPVEAIIKQALKLL